MTSEWHYAVDGEKKGPVVKPVLQEMLRSGALPSDTMVWKKGMSAWAAASTIEGLVPVPVDDGPPPLPESGSPELPPAVVVENQVWTPPPSVPDFIKSLKYPWEPMPAMPAWLCDKWSHTLRGLCETYRSRIPHDTYWVGKDSIPENINANLRKNLCLPSTCEVIAFLDSTIALFSSARGSCGLAMTAEAIYWRCEWVVRKEGPYRLPCTELFWGIPFWDGSKAHFGIHGLGDGRVNLFFQNHDQAVYDLIKEAQPLFQQTCGHKTNP